MPIVHSYCITRLDQSFTVIEFMFHKTNSFYFIPLSPNYSMILVKYFNLWTKVCAQSQQLSNQLVRHLKPSVQFRSVFISLTAETSTGAPINSEAAPR